MSKLNPKQLQHCFKCDKIIHRMHKDCDVWIEGIVGRIRAGYKSALEGNTYTIAICDDCVKASDKIKQEKSRHLHLN